MNPYTDRWRSVITRYLAGQESLESAATELANAWREWRRALDVGRPTNLEELVADRPNLDALYADGGFGAELTEKDFPRLDQLMDLVGRKMRDSDEGAA